eukprot:Amastigsp_a8538_32.p2 type:complete len:115 gc:universal Amastigsp_a8538_32:274-618(+)
MSTQNIPQQNRSKRSSSSGGPPSPGRRTSPLSRARLASLGRRLSELCSSEPRVPLDVCSKRLMSRSTNSLRRAACGAWGARLSLSSTGRRSHASVFASSCDQLLPTCASIILFT